MEGKLKISFIGDSHIAYWPFESYFPKWECYNYGVRERAGLCGDVS